MRQCPRTTARRLATLIALAGLFAPAASANNFYLGFGFGGGDIEADAAEFSDNPDVLSDTAGEGVAASEIFAGMQFDSGLLLEVARDDYDTFDLFLTPLLQGDVNYSATRLSVGIAPETASRFGFVGKLGLTFWDLELTESPLANPGSEAVSSRDGTALYLQVGGEFRVTQGLRLGASFDYTDTDAGSAQAIKLNLRYLFAN